MAPSWQGQRGAATRVILLRHGQTERVAEERGHGEPVGEGADHAGLGRGPQAGQRIAWIGRVAVEEMLGVEQHLAPPARRMGDRGAVF